MKKILAILLALVLMLSLVACGTDTSGDNDDVQNNGGNDADGAADADVCYECGDELDADDEGWMSSVYDDDGNMIDVYICDDCWEAEQNGDGDADADVDAGATGDADVDAGATEDNDDADETANGGYTGTPQYSGGGDDVDEGELVECSVCGKKITEAEACIEATVVGTTVERTYYCNDCFEE